MRVREKLLTKDEIALIGMFYESAEWRILKKLIDNEVANISKIAITSDTLEKLSEYRGQIYQLNKIKTELHRLHNEYEKSRSKRNEKKEI